jgi:hypothetical protein
MPSSTDSLLKELKDQGFQYRNVNKIFDRKELQPDEVEIIIKWLVRIYEEDVGAADTLVRSLVSAKRAFDPSVLISLFDKSDLNFYLKSGIGIALAHGKTTDISQWLRNKLLNEPFAEENYSLIGGLFEKGKFKDVNDYMLFMRSIFDKYASEVLLKIFDKYGSKDDMKFLQEKAARLDIKLTKKINLIIKKHGD